MSIANILQNLGIQLQPPPKPAAAYVHFVQSGNLVFVSGHISRRNGAPWTGKFGDNLVTADGAAIGRSAAIELLGTLQVACGGDLERVQRIVKVLSLVNSTPDYTEHHLVTNGCSELLVQVFGDRGHHARSAFGVASLPLGAALEVELIAQLAPAR